MLTDSHCHLASHRFDPAEIPDLIARARARGVTRMVSLATGLDDLDANLSIASSHPEVSVCIGIHPCEVHEAPDDAIDRLREHVADPRVCGIGETGLDYYHPAPPGWSDDTFRERQRAMLDAHFRLAAGAGLNVVIHTRDRTGDASFRDALAIYRAHADRTRAVFHCFPGSASDAREVAGLGGLVSFGGITTFRNAGDALATALAVDDGAFMIETDSPYLSPVPHRGKRNEPAFSRDIADFLARARGTPAETLAATTNRTAAAFFRFTRRD